MALANLKYTKLKIKIKIKKKKKWVLFALDVPITPRQTTLIKKMKWLDSHVKRIILIGLISIIHK